MKFWQSGLSRQIIALTVSVVMAAAIVIGMTALFVFHKYSKEHAKDAGQDIAISIANEIDGLMSQNVHFTEAIADNPDIDLNDPGKTQSAIEPVFKTINAFETVGIADINGNVKVTVPEQAPVLGKNISDRPYFQAAVSSGRSFISEPLVGISGKDLVVVASPIKDRSGKISGIVAASINLRKSTKFADIIRNESLDPGMMIQIVSRNGKIVYHPDKKMIARNIHPYQVFRDVLQGEAGSREITVEDTPVLAGHAPVKELGWRVLVLYPISTALASAFYLRDIMIVATVLISLLVFFITYLESRAIVRPLEMLLEGVKRVAEGDYQIAVNVTSQNEIGLLAESFNTMVARFKEMREDSLEKKAELEKINIELEVMAITDGLTKLYNHRYFQDCLDKALSLTASEGKSLTLLIIDIDYFKYYNDLFGHQSGDRLLEELAQLLIRELGPNDMVARYGGEEFTVILYDSDNKHGLAVAEKIRTAIETFPFYGREQQPEGKVTVSIGVASCPENAKTKEELVRLADEALYKAKSFSRNKVELYFSVLDDLKKDLDQSEVELINSIKMLVRIINAKDKYTYGHSERVSKYAVSIAEKMGLSESEIKTIKIGAFLHDVGKIEISRSILMKKGPLTCEEFEIINKHPFWGAGIVKAVESLHPTLPLIKYHHERYDGSGYPTGSAGAEIPLHARILAVADSYDAMTSNRPYRKRKTHTEAVEELKKCAGSQFDPEVLRAFLCSLREQDEKVG